jgi:hypothetical protein
MKILCFGHTIDPAFVNKAYSQHLIVLLPKHSKHLREYFKSSTIKYFNCKKSVIVEDYSDTELLRKSEVIKVIKKLKCSHFLVSHRSSFELFKRCNKLNLTPIGNDPIWGSKLENKIYFDRLLSKLKINKPKTINISVAELKDNLLPIVVQDATSFGSFGTTIVESSKQLAKIKNKSKSNTDNLLIRKFVNGNVFGITMVIHNKGIILSSIRQQCYFDKITPDSDLIFAGIQWVNKKSFSTSAIKEIEKSCCKIGAFLKKNRFTGVIHFDFMVDKTKVYFLECNPRPSSATPQLLSSPKLIHNLDFSPILLHKFENLPNKPTIPNCNYRGSLLDLMIFGKNQINQDQRQIFNSKNIKYFFSINRLQSSRKPSFLGSILTNKTLFTSGGKLNEFGKKLYSKYTGIVI